MSNITVDGTELISLMKSMRDMLKAADAELGKAKIDKPPKIGDNQANMAVVGGKAVGAPGTNVVTKSVQDDAPGASVGGEQSEELSSQESSMLNAAAIPEEPKSLADVLEDDENNNETSEDKSKEKEDDDEIIEKAFPAGHPDGCFCEECKAARAEKEGMDTAQIKSLIKDMRSVLKDNSTLRKELNILKSTMDINIKKSADKQVEAQLRKLGIVKTQPAIRKLDLGANQFEDIKKSQDDLEFNSLVGKPENLVNDLSAKSWAELGQLREQTGDLQRFKGWHPTPEMYNETNIKNKTVRS